jgi:hypothetical protein
MFWAYGAFVGGRLLTLAAIAILARILTPAEFGIVALALAFMLSSSTPRRCSCGGSGSAPASRS